MAIYGDGKHDNGVITSFNLYSNNSLKLREEKDKLIEEVINKMFEDKDKIKDTLLNSLENKSIKELKNYLK